MKMPRLWTPQKRLLTVRMSDTRNAVGDISPRPQRVLFVCTANITRSPAAHHLAQAATEKAGLGVSFRSAGVRARGKVSMDPKMVSALPSSIAASASKHLSTLLTADLVDDADLILCAERSHVVDIVTGDPSTLNRTFTIRSFARLLAALPGWSLGEPRPEVGSLGGDGGMFDDIPDPTGRWRRHYRTCAAELSDFVDQFVGWCDPATTR